jgi:hypothetical protein
MIIAASHVITSDPSDRAPNQEGDEHSGFHSGVIYQRPKFIPPTIPPYGYPDLKGEEFPKPGVFEVAAWGPSKFNNTTTVVGSLMDRKIKNNL